MSIDAFIPPADFPLSPPLEPEWTMEDLQSHLDGVPIHRIRLWPSPGTATEADLLRTKNCELIDGVLVEKPMGWAEMLVATELVAILNAFVKRHDLGLVFCDNTPYRVTKRRTRVPDVSYFCWERFPNRKGPASKTCRLDRIWSSKFCLTVTRRRRWIASEKNSSPRVQSCFG